MNHPPKTLLWILMIFIAFLIPVIARTSRVLLMGGFQQNVSEQETAEQQQTGARAELVTDSDIERILERFVEEKTMPGVMAAIAVEDQPLRIAACGIRKVGEEELITIHDKMHLGSCTKAITAALVGRLIDSGRITMETTVADAMPQFAAQIHADYANVTLRQLLEMRGSIPETQKWRMQVGENIIERRQLIAIDALQEKPRHEPGTHFEYTNLSVALAGMMCESVTGNSWEELVQAEVFDVLGMESAGFGVPNTADETDQPWGHHALVEGRLTPVQMDNAPALGPAGTVHMSLEDWSTFLMEMTASRPQELLSEPTRVMLITPSENADDYACGWLVTKKSWAAPETKEKEEGAEKKPTGTAIWHNGSNTFWYSLTWVAPDRNTAYQVVVNAYYPSVEQDADRIIGELIKLNE